MFDKETPLKKITVRQSSERPSTFRPCAHPNDIKWAERFIAEAKQSGGHLRFDYDIPIQGKQWKFGEIIPLSTFQAHLKYIKEIIKKRCVACSFMVANSRNRHHSDLAETKVGKNPWWEADLEKPYSILSIAVFPPDGKAHELNGLVVAMSDTVSGDKLMWDNSKTASGFKAVRRFKLGAAAMAIINPPYANVFTKRVGNETYRTRYIRIYRPGTGKVALGEVQKFNSAGVVMTR